MTRDIARWRRPVSNACFVLGIGAFATLLAAGSLIWVEVAVTIGIVGVIASQLLWPWRARFPRRAPLTPPPANVRQQKQPNGP